MINFTATQDNKYKTLEVIGHANHSRSFDAVCGMVSVLIETCIFGCKEYAMVKEAEIADGYARIKCRKNDKVAMALMGSCIVGIEEVRERFPQCFGGNNGNE